MRGSSLRDAARGELFEEAVASSCCLLCKSLVVSECNIFQSAPQYGVVSVCNILQSAPQYRKADAYMRLQARAALSVDKSLSASL